MNHRSLASSRPGRTPWLPQAGYSHETHGGGFGELQRRRPRACQRLVGSPQCKARPDQQVRPGAVCVPGQTTRLNLYESPLQRSPFWQRSGSCRPFMQPAPWPSPPTACTPRTQNPGGLGLGRPGRGGDAGCPAPPSQIPAGSIPAPGSSDQLALAYASGCVSLRGKCTRCWHRLSSNWQGIPPCFSTMRGRGTWKRASRRLTAGQVRLFR